MCPRTLEARNFPCLFLVDPRENRNRLSHGREQSKLVTEPREEGEGLELGGELRGCHTKIRRRRCQLTAQCTMCQPLSRQDLPAVSKGQECGQRQCQGDGKDTMTKDEILSSKATGGMQTLDTRSSTLTCPR